MEKWVPLFKIFLNSRTPETEASIWLQQSFNTTTSSSSTPSISTASFLSLLTKPTPVASSSTSNPSSLATKRVMFVQTLPDMIQSRILSFLVYDRERFCQKRLFELAKCLLCSDQDTGFWVKRAALNLLDVVSMSGHISVSVSSLVSSKVDSSVDAEFVSVPVWLKDAASECDSILPWLSLSQNKLDAKEWFGGPESGSDFESRCGESESDDLEEVMEDMEIDWPVNVPLRREIAEAAVGLRPRVLNFVPGPKTVELVTEICKLCLESGVDSLSVLELIEPWRTNDEAASVLVSYLSNESENKLGWPSQVLCSIILPKMLVLKEAASRSLMTTTTEFCKVHQRAAEYALLIPLMLKMGGINNPLHDVITRVFKECLHPTHVSALCRKLLCGGGERGLVCLPCHKCLISNELVWTELLFHLFHGILNLSVQLTQDSVDQLALRSSDLAQEFSRSLKFGNFLLCFITKCGLLLEPHKVLLAEAARKTNTIVTKSILSKLASL